MRKLILIAALMTVAGCSQPLAPQVGLAQETAGRVPGPAMSCIPYEINESIRVIDQQTLVYGWGRTIFINRLGAACPGLRPTSTLIVEPNGSRYCRGDRMRSQDAGVAVPGPTCLLGDWVPYRKL